MPGKREAVVRGSHAVLAMMRVSAHRISVLTWLDWPHVPGSASLSFVCFCHSSIFFRSFACTAAYSGFP